MYIIHYCVSNYVTVRIIHFSAVCQELSNPAFGSVTWTDRTIGSNATYTCDSGYTLVGNMIRTCELLDVDTADWSAEAPTCERKCVHSSNHKH